MLVAHTNGYDRSKLYDPRIYNTEFRKGYGIHIESFHYISFSRAGYRLRANNALLGDGKSGGYEVESYTKSEISEKVHGRVTSLEVDVKILPPMMTAVLSKPHGRMPPLKEVGRQEVPGIPIAKMCYDGGPVAEIRRVQQYVLHKSP